MKARWKIALIGALVTGATSALADSGMIDEARDTWRDLKVRAKEMKAHAREMLGMRPSADMGCPMMGGGGMRMSGP